MAQEKVDDASEPGASSAGKCYANDATGGMVFQFTNHGARELVN
jgi:hypothetical protein